MAADALWYLAIVELRCGPPRARRRVRRAGAGADRQYVRDEAESPQSLFPSRSSPPIAASSSARASSPTELPSSPSVHAARLRAPLGRARAGRALERRRRRGRRAASPPPKQDRRRGRRGRAGMSWWRAEQVEALLELGLVDDAVVRARRVGGGCTPARARLGARARDALPRARRGRARRRRAGGRRCSTRRSRSTRRSAIRSAARGRCSRSASPGGARGRSGRARDAIEAARAGFEELGAAGWAERAREELGAIGGRTRSEGLTPAERRVADLVASGTDERGGRGGALPRRAHGGEPPDARLRQARRALAHRARAQARGVDREQSSDVLTFSRTRPGRSVDGMPSYLVETFLARGHAGERTAREDRARSAAEELTRAGTSVRFDGVIHVPEDEICFFVFGAPSGRRGRAGGAAGRARPRSRRRGGHVRRGVADEEATDAGRRGRAAVSAAAPGGGAGGHGDAVEPERDARAFMVTAGQGPQLSVPHMAMVHGAVYDAVNAIDGGHEGYLLTSRVATPFDSKEAAAATAAYKRALAPRRRRSRRCSTRSTRRRSPAIPDGSPKTRGIAVGEAAAAAMIAARTDDGRFGAFRFAVGSAARACGGRCCRRSSTTRTRG